MSTAESKFQGFVPLGPLVHLHEPKSSSTTSSGIPLLIVCTWMNAPIRPVQSYVKEYISLFGDSRILLVQSTSTAMFFSSKATVAKLHQPALDVILSLSAEDQKRIRIASYSNGGINAANILATMYKEKTGRRLKVPVMLADSAPGAGDIASAHKALSFRLPQNIILYTVTSIILWTVLLLWKFVRFITNSEHPLAKISNSFNDLTIWDNEGCKRVFIYSKGDLLVPYVDLAESVIQSRKMGWAVQEEEFVGSKHVGHALIDKERYWNIVKEALV